VVTLKVLRDSQTITLEMTLAPRPEQISP
jgi:hypothetical protein